MESQELRLKTDKEPTIFNKDMLFYGLVTPIVTGLVGAIASLIIPGADKITNALGGYAEPVLQYGAIATGGLLGGLLGKNRIERENTEGKEARSPSIFNKKLVIGLFLPRVAVNITIAAVELITRTPLVDMLGAPALFAIGLTSLASMAIGAYVGGTMGKKEMEKDFVEAKKQLIVTHLSQNVSPEVGQAVAYSMEHSKDWAKNVINEKLLAEAQQPAR